LAQPEVSRALDESTFLVLPSRSEGMGRVVVEAFCRGRPVLGSRVGGIPDLVEDGVNGLLVDPQDTNGLAEALIRLLTDRELAERLAAAAHTSADRWTISPEEFARRIRGLVQRVTGLS
jgi:glycosyltransferase involved in cell wall biosynthesis